MYRAVGNFVNSINRPAFDRPSLLFVTETSVCPKTDNFYFQIQADEKKYIKPVEDNFITYLSSFQRPTQRYYFLRISRRYKDLISIFHWQSKWKKNDTIAEELIRSNIFQQRVHFCNTYFIIAVQECTYFHSVHIFGWQLSCSGARVIGRCEP